MRRLKILLILLGVLIAGSIAVYCISRHEQKKEEIKNTDAVILSVSPKTVKSLSWEYDGTARSFHKDGSWLYDGDSTFPVSEEKIGELLAVFENFGASFEIDNVSDLSQYGLTSPECTIRISAEGGDTTVLLGSFSTMDQKRYVSVGDGKVYLVNHDPMSDYELTLPDMIRQDTVPSAGIAGATKIRFSGAENYEISLIRDSGLSANTNDLYFTEEQPLSTTYVTTLIAKIRSLGLKDYVSYNADTEDLAPYGLDTPELTVTMDYPVKNEEDDSTVLETFILHLGRNREELAEAEKTAPEEADAEEGSDPLADVACYARVGDSQIIYQIDYDSFAAIRAVSYNDLRHREVLNAAFSDITGIDIELEGSSYSLTTKADIENDEVVRTWFGPDGEEIDSSLTSALSAALTGLTASDADSFTSDAPDGKEEIALTVFIDNDSFPQTEIHLYRHDGSLCLAAVDGESLCYVPRSSAVSLVEAVNAIVLK